MILNSMKSFPILNYICKIISALPKHSTYNSMNFLYKILTLFSLVLLTACSMTKKVPDKEYLLYKYHIQTDIRDISKSELDEYLRQTPNSTIFGTLPLRLYFYNWAGNDSTKKRNKLLMQVGEAPVIFDQNMTQASAQQIQKLYQSKGYINATVSSDVKFKNKKATVTYMVKSNKPYTIRNYKIKIPQQMLKDIAADTSRALVKENMLFDTDQLNAERERITKSMRQKGYYNFSKEFVIFAADSNLNAHKIDLTLELREYQKKSRDSINNLIFKQYKIDKVIFYTNSDAGLTADIQNLSLDTVRYNRFIQISPAKKFITLDALMHNTYINPGAFYNDDNVEKTYSALNTLGPVKYTNISFRENQSGELDCYIIIVPSKTISFSTEAEGTFTDGFWGGGLNLNFANRNAFKGAEQFSSQIHGSMEWQAGVWAKEVGVKLALKFPKFIFPVGSYELKRNLHMNTDLSSNISYMSRPNEYTVMNVGGGVTYNWTKNNFRHNFDIFNLSYINFLDISSDFRTAYLNTGIYNRYNYVNHFIMRTGYNGSYSTFNPNRPLRNYSTTRYGIETAGNVLYALNNLLKSTPGADGYYSLFGIRYAQYVRTEYNSTYHQIFDKNNRFVYHLGVGLGIPFGNADVIPYERRFFSGGANSVRGWSESSLGPGTYQKDSTVRTRDYNQVGDIKLDLNMEYRAKLFWLMEGAAFLDAGNIWTIKDYDEQPGGQFKLDSFLNQIAIAYGAGLRFDFSFFIFRFDVGMKLYDPSLSRVERWRVNPNWTDLAFHVAIGYPF